VIIAEQLSIHPTKAITISSEIEQSVNEVAFVIEFN